MRSTSETIRLYCYRLPSATFETLDENAGYFISKEAVTPEGVDVIDNPMFALQQRGVDVRILPNLWPLHDAVAGSTLEFSMIRMRNARPRIE
jgi:hypothetical protein